MKRAPDALRSFRDLMGLSAKVSTLFRSLPGLSPNKGRGGHFYIGRNGRKSAGFMKRNTQLIWCPPGVEFENLPFGSVQYFSSGMFTKDVGVEEEDDDMSISSEEGDVEVAYPLVFTAPKSMDMLTAGIECFEVPAEIHSNLVESLRRAGRDGIPCKDLEKTELDFVDEITEFMDWTDPRAILGNFPGIVSDSVFYKVQ